MVGAEVLVEGAVAEHVVGGGQDRGGDGTDGLLGATSVAQALELGLQIAGLFASPGPGALHQGGLEPGRALAQPGAASLAGAFIVARAQATLRWHSTGVASGTSYGGFVVKRSFLISWRIILA